MRIYLAGSSNELDLCAGYMDRLRAAGHTITVDWVANIREVAAKNGFDNSANPREASEVDRQKWSFDDLSGVESADLIWLLVPQVGGKGCWVELGYAIAMVRFADATARVRDKHTIVVSGDYKTCIFTSRADAQFETHEEALSSIITSNKW